MAKAKEGLDAKGVLIMLAIGTVIIAGVAYWGRKSTEKRMGKR